MTSFDWGQAGARTVWAVVLIVGALWIGQILALATVRWDSLSAMDERDRNREDAA